VSSQSIMTAYAIIDVKWKDETQHKKLAENFFPILEKFGGKLVAASGKPEVVLGRWKLRTVEIFEFPTLEAYRSWFGSPEFAPLLDIVKKYSDIKGFVIEGTG
jgi:uncharacterized protein (DUF1330 family)